MSATAADTVPGRGGLSSLWHRQLYSYPDTGARFTYLAITVLDATTGDPKRVWEFGRDPGALGNFAQLGPDRRLVR